jgi:hypothetical protein
MKHSRQLLAGVALLAVLATSGRALGQDPTTASDLEMAASSTPQDKIAYAESANAEINEAVRQINRLLEQARKESDADAIECLISRFTSVRALLQVSQSAEISMKNSIAAAEEEKANHEYRKIAVAVSKSRMLLAEAQRCASEDQLESGTTLVDFTTVLGEGGDTLPDVTITTTNLEPPPVSPFL